MGVLLITFLHIVATDAEHSRDSNSRTVEITYQAGVLTVQVTRTGRGARTEPKLERRLDEKDIRHASMLVNDALAERDEVDVPFQAPGTEYSFAMDVTRGHITNKRRIHGPLRDDEFRERIEVTTARALVTELEKLAASK